MINDVHCHFFSTRFFEILGGQLSPAEDDASTTLPERLGWDAPGSPEALADRWVQTLDAQEVGRAAVMASLPGDEASVGTAVRRHPGRLVGMTMFNPVAPDADVRIRTALEDERLRCVCLFPALHGYPLAAEAHGCDCVPCSMEGEAEPPLAPCRWRGGARLPRTPRAALAGSWCGRTPRPRGTGW